MPDRTYHISEIVGTSPQGMDSAIRNAIATASQKFDHVSWFEVVHMRGHVHQGEVDHFQVTLKVGYRLDD